MWTRHGAALAALVLAACGAPVQAADDTPGERLAAIEAAQAAASERYSQELQQVEQTEAARQAPIDRYLKEVVKNVEAALELARANPGDPAAFEALKFVIRTNGSGPGDGSARALQLMLDHGDDRRPGQGDYLAHVALRLWQYPDAEALLRRILDRNPNRDDRAAACYWLARYLSEQARICRMLREKPGNQKNFEGQLAAEPIGRFVEEKEPVALDTEVEALLGRAIAEFGDVRMPEYTQSIAEIARGELFAARSLNVGQTAPEIEGADHEGKPFTLGETRGKVVLLTFTGSWCGPCVAMYPQMRELRSRHQDEPFAIVSVDTDTEVEALKEAIASGEITWRCWWDGGTDGPITTRWGIDSFPSIFVLDRHGVIRFKDVRGDDLDRAVANLLGAPDAVSSPR
ncbi:TlpA disulfide reductase family protein [Tautonia plasticadhaerens]|uniref:Thiol-disulfide oxidoreductase ResA n=1 Tax=Tautonia plasticadhaerens TaxID=2527974 RepID=A0A518HD29_9BACT|nr:TlpA disulfide reductase family protein [Tautonia plasticadhaerens]QDV38740.1 Thiol-disulfide oxidoreductase ResA [Tautonia plasticadhaerens]